MDGRIRNRRTEPWEAETSMAVSYTHLDVYKRQIVTHSMQQAARISDRTAFFLMGEIVEYNETNTIFMNPGDKRTEDYITGRFG